jgi:hypothetical protein
MASKERADRAEQAPSEQETSEALEKVIDSGAGAPGPQRQAAEDLPDNDPVQQATKEAELATDAQAEAQAKARVVEESPYSGETPSGYALQKTAGVGNDVERGEAYAREKNARRWGYVPAEEKP